MRYWNVAGRALARRVAAGTNGGADRGDVPGWVLVTLMTAGLVAGLWLVAGPALEGLFVEAISDVRP